MYDKEVEELLNNPLSAHIKISMDRKPDGTRSINNLEMDPDKIESEKELFDYAIDKISQINVNQRPKLTLLSFLKTFDRSTVLSC